jgi:hypothetical protein
MATGAFLVVWDAAGRVLKNLIGAMEFIGLLNAYRGPKLEECDRPRVVSGLA